MSITDIARRFCAPCPLAAGLGAPGALAAATPRKRRRPDGAAGGVAPPPTVTPLKSARKSTDAGSQKLGAAAVPQVASISYADSSSALDTTHVCTPDAARCARCLFTRRRRMWSATHPWLRVLPASGPWGVGCAICGAARQSGPWAKGQVRRPQFDTLRKHERSARHKKAAQHCVENGLLPNVVCRAEPPPGDRSCGQQKALGYAPSIAEISLVVARWRGRSTPPLKILASRRTASSQG